MSGTKQTDQLIRFAWPAAEYPAALRGDFYLGRTQKVDFNFLSAA